MIDLFEKVRPEIPSKYRKLAEKGMNAVNEGFERTRNRYDSWGRMPWFEKTEYVKDTREFSIVMIYSADRDRHFVMDLVIDIDNGEIWVFQKCQNKGFSASCAVKLFVDDYEQYMDFVFDNAHKMFDNVRLEIRSGDEVIYNDGLDWVRGIVEDVTAERYEVDFGDFEIYEEIEYFTSAKHWGFPEGSVSQ